MTHNLKRFDIVLVDYGIEVIGSEQGGIRPSIIIQNDMGNIHSSTTIVMPLTKQIKRLNQPTHTLITKGEGKGIVEDSMVLGECMRQVSEKRIIKYLGSITEINEKRRIKRVYDANFGEVA
ncbi:type II toxin-antitoxin system PemK/MazF family toxin [Konateibacter massiliensis]|uniref:type II toxin-antitoxin system PemK/MazF family toxin n=1 Tax=Konateibacter massiliensis TaxID=2002841 RepID=UPI000C15BA73|nr:type II toxin-antitoxin system PemK/MazF family toxin [Konateibacter massiliensis]